MLKESFFYFMIIVSTCSIPGMRSNPVHWRFRLDVGSGWDPPKGSDTSYLTVGESRRIHQELKDVHRNTVLLKGQAQANSMWHSVTCYIGVALTALTVLGGIVYKIQSVKRMIPTSERNQEHAMTVLPSAPMWHY